MKILIKIMHDHVKSVHFGHVHSQFFAQVNARVHGKMLFLSYHVIVIFEQLTRSSEAHFPLNIFHKSLGLLLCQRRMHMTKMNRLYKKGTRSCRIMQDLRHTLVTDFCVILWKILIEILS